MLASQQLSLSPMDTVSAALQMVAAKQKVESTKGELPRRKKPELFNERSENAFKGSRPLIFEGFHFEIDEESVARHNESVEKLVAEALERHKQKKEKQEKEKQEKKKPAKKKPAKKKPAKKRPAKKQQWKRKFY